MMCLNSFILHKITLDLNTHVLIPKVPFVSSLSSSTPHGPCPSSHLLSFYVFLFSLAKSFIHTNNLLRTNDQSLILNLNLSPHTFFFLLALKK